MPSRGTSTAWSRPSVFEPVAASRAKRTILIAEDSVDSCEMMQMLFRLKGYDVLAATDGPGALEMATTAVPDLILLDLQLPKLDGLGVTRELRRRPELKNVPIVIISGHDPRKYRQAALDAGCDDYLLKPIDFDRFSEWLMMIGKRSARARAAS